MDSKPILLQVVTEAQGLKLPFLEGLYESEYTIRVFHNIEDALKAHNSLDFTAAVYFHSHDGKSCPDFFNSLKEKNPDIIRILVMSSPNIEDTIEAVNAGSVNKILIAPDGSEEIVRIIEDTKRLTKTPFVNISDFGPELNDKLSEFQKHLQSSMTSRSQSILRKKTVLEKLRDELQSNLFDTIQALFTFLEKKNSWIGRHSKVVAALSSELARALDLPEEDILRIEVAALLHDVGKIGIPDNIVSKAAHLLTKQQLVQLAQHVYIGRDLLRPIISLAEISQLIFSHHEHFDGKGYPKSLSGKAIPLGARIIAVTNNFDNLINKVHSRVNDKYERSIRDINVKSGTILDPEITGVFIEMLTANREKTSEEKKEDAFTIDQLQPGMMLARDIYSTRGTNIIRKGQVLSDQHIKYIREFDRIEKVMGEIYVYSRPEQIE